MPGHYDTSLAARGDIQPPAFLSILSGKSNFKQRPISTSRFLIGAGNTCQLQLGGHGIPLVHSIIEFEKGLLRINSLVSNPELIVNNRSVRSSQLTDGDVISIGVYRFQVHLEVESATKTIPFTTEVKPASLVPEAAIETLLPAEIGDDELDLEQLSASELVDLIEQEMTLVEQQEQAERQAARHLLDAIVQRAQQNETENVLADDEEQHILETLAELSENLEDCQTQLNTTPWQDESRIRSLLSTQEQLLSRLEEAIVWLRDSRDDQQKQSA